MLPYFLPEITPRVLRPQVWRLGGLKADDVSGNVRAVAEAQAMAMYLHSGWTGPRPRTILVTAGGSENRGLLSVISQVFGAEVKTLEIRESAALGAAMRAAHAWLNRNEYLIGWREIREQVVPSGPGHLVQPSEAAARIYQGAGGLLEVYAACERFALGQGPHPETAISAFRETFL
jgi:sugar (pentulose or hexulose) kinase